MSLILIWYLDQELGYTNHPILKDYRTARPGLLHKGLIDPGSEYCCCPPVDSIHDHLYHCVHAIPG